MFLLALVLTGAGPVSSLDRSRSLVELPRPRQLSEAERAAVELVAAYFQGGPVAWWEELAADAPLRRLGREAAMQEIGVRAGPADGATWQLLTPGPKLEPQTAVFGVEFASGLDETLVLRLVDQGGWKIAGLRISVEPAGPRPGSLPGTAAAKPPAPRRAVSEPPAAPGPGGPPSWLSSRSDWREPRAPSCWRAPASAGRRSQPGPRPSWRQPAWGSGCGRPLPPRRRTRRKKHPRRPRIQGSCASPPSLRCARPSLTAATARRSSGGWPHPPPTASREVQELWRAQYLLLESNLTAAGATLDRIPAAKAPLADLLLPAWPSAVFSGRRPRRTTTR